MREVSSVELASWGWSPAVVLAVRVPADVTPTNATDTGAYVDASPTSKVRLGEPVATDFRRLPLTWPAVRDTEPPEATMRVCPPVATMPAVRVSTPVTVASAPRVTPAASEMVRPLKVVAKLPPTDWPVLPPSETVPVPPLKAPVEALLVQSPETANVAGPLIVPPEMVTSTVVIEPPVRSQRARARLRQGTGAGGDPGVGQRDRGGHVERRAPGVQSDAAVGVEREAGGGAQRAA